MSRYVEDMFDAGCLTRRRMNEFMLHVFESVNTSEETKKRGTHMNRNVNPVRDYTKKLEAYSHCGLKERRKNKIQNVLAGQVCHK